LVTPQCFAAGALRRLALLTAVATAMIVALAPGMGQAHAANLEKDPVGVHTIEAEISPSGTRAPSVKVDLSRPSAADRDALRSLCSGHAVEYGDWVNADPTARGIARIELRDCQSVTTCSGTVCTITYDAGWRMHVFGKCSPTNCDWGWSAGQFRLSSGHIYGYYDQGFAKRYVYAMMSQYRPGQLWVYWRTDFVDPNRADYDLQEWFVRA
jgi:hypothetical protein